MRSHILFTLLFVSIASTASAQRLVAIQDEAKLRELCDLPATQLTKELYFTQVTGASFGEYDTTKGTLPLTANSLAAFSGALQITSASPLQAPLSPDIAKTLVTLHANNKTELYAAFLVNPNKPCTKTGEPGHETIHVDAELALLEMSKKSNGRPLLRFETPLYSQWKKEESLNVVLTPPTVLSGEGTLGKISDALPQNKPLLQRCYAKSLSSNPKAQGTLTAMISLDQNGDPSNVNITIDTLGDKVVQSCVIESLQQIKYAVSNTSFSFTIYLLHQ